ncbi:hypothetical protein Tco_0225614 [Tanacetum coccineum]
MCTLQPVDQTLYSLCACVLDIRLSLPKSTLKQSKMRIMRDVRIREEVRREVLSFLEIDWLAGHQRSKEARPSPPGFCSRGGDGGSVDVVSVVSVMLEGTSADAVRALRKFMLCRVSTEI